MEYGRVGWHESVGGRGVEGAGWGVGGERAMSVIESERDSWDKDPGQRRLFLVVTQSAQNREGRVQDMLASCTLGSN